MAHRALTILSGLAKGKVFPLSGERITLGRDEHSTIEFDDTDISREHALLTLEGQEYRLKDLQSRNGTRVNGQRVQEKLLAPGDRIAFGLVETRYEATAPAIPKPGPAVRTVTVPARPATPVQPPPRPAPVARPTASPTPVPRPVVPPSAPKAVTPPVEGQSPRADLAVQKDLSAKTAELAQARPPTSRVTELTQQNQTLMAELRAMQEKLTAVERELSSTKEAAARQVAMARKQAEDSLQAKAAEVVKLSELEARVEVLVREKQESEKVRQAAETDLTRLRAELATTREQAGRMAELSRQNQELTTRLSDQQQAAAREMAELTATRTKLQKELEEHQGDQGRLEDVERKNRELTALVTAAKGREKEIVERVHGEQQRLEKELSGSRADWEQARRRLAQSDQLEQQNKILATQLAALRVELAEARKQGTITPAAKPSPTPALEKLVVPSPTLALDKLVVSESGSSPVEDEDRPREGRSGKTAAIVGTIAVIMIVVGWLGWHSQDAGSTAQAEAALITTPRNVEPSPAPNTVSAPSLSVEEASASYVDPKGRFVCQVPRGWTVQELDDEHRSRVKFVSGNDEIRVTSYGADWPALRPDDRVIAEKAIASLLQLDNQEDGSFAEVVSRGWREIGEVPAYQMDLKLAMGPATWGLRVVYFREAGREHFVTLYLRTKDQQDYLTLVLERFLEGFHSKSQQEPAAS